MELRYENLKNKPKTFRAFTGLDVAEFQILLKTFTIAWKRYVQEHRLPADVRQRGCGGGRKARLATNEDKLLFILVYFNGSSPQWIWRKVSCGLRLSWFFGFKA